MIANAPSRSIDAAETKEWISGIGAEAFDAAVGRLVATRTVRIADRTLSFGDEHARALQEPPLAGVMGDAAAAAAAAAAADAVVAAPTATDGETAAWITMLASGATAALDTGPLAALRRRTHLNSRSLDDVETECVVTIRGSAPPVDVAPPGMLGIFEEAASGDVPSAVEAAGADGLPADALDAAPGGAIAVGYDCARLIHPAHMEAWTVPTARGALAPRVWRTLDGGVDGGAWRRALALVVGWVLARPGVSLARLVAHVRPALDRMETCDVVGAAVRAGVLAIRADGPWHAQPDERMHVDVGDTPWYVGAMS